MTIQPIRVLFFILLLQGIELAAGQADSSEIKMLVLENSEYRSSTNTRKFKENKKVTIRTTLKPNENVRGKLEILNDSTVKIDSLEIPISSIVKIRKNNFGNKLAGGLFLGSGLAVVGLGTALIFSGSAGGILAGTSIILYTAESPLRLGYRLLRGNPEQINGKKSLHVEVKQKVKKRKR